MSKCSTHASGTGMLPATIRQLGERLPRCGHWLLDRLPLLKANICFCVLSLEQSRECLLSVFIIYGIKAMYVIEEDQYY